MYGHAGDNQMPSYLMLHLMVTEVLPEERTRGRDVAEANRDRSNKGTPVSVDGHLTRDASVPSATRTRNLRQGYAGKKRRRTSPSSTCFL